MTSPAPGVTGAEAQRVREHGDLQGEDEGLSRPTHPTMIISSQRQGLALQFSPQALSWEGTLSMGWSLCGSGVFQWQISTHLQHKVRSAIQGKRPSSQAIPNIKATRTSRQGRPASSQVREDVTMVSPSPHQ